MRTLLASYSRRWSVPKKAERKSKPILDELLSLAEMESKLLDLNADERVRLLRKENQSLRRKLSEKETGLELVRDAFCEAYNEPLDIRLPALPKSGKAKPLQEIAVIHLSDVHFGKRTETYSFEVAEERVRELARTVLRLVEIRRNFARIDELRVYLGGDLVEGDGIFPGQAFESDADLVKQAIKRGPEVLCECILLWLTRFKSIKVVGVPGNHGRASRFGSKRLNYDSLFYDVLRHMVAIAGHSARIQWDLPFDRPSGREWYAVDQVFGWGSLIVHGDQIHGQLGMPWYGVGKKAGGWIDTVPDPWSYLFFGHFHTLAKFTINKRLMLANGTTESSNAYAAENMAACGDPVQRCAFFDAKHGLIADQPIYLSERTPAR
jgi:hypothetical protein